MDVPKVLPSVYWEVEEGHTARLLPGVCDSDRRAGAVLEAARSVLLGATNPFDHTYTHAAAGVGRGE